MANGSCGKRRLLNGELRASCQETCAVRGSALLPRTFGKCENETCGRIREERYLVSVFRMSEHVWYTA